MVDLMKKFIWLSLFLVLLSGNSDARYERKLKEPNFFIPETAVMHKAEKLPPIKIKTQEKKEQEKEEQAIDNSLYDIAGVPDYKQKYNQYLSDIRVFSKTGKMPINKTLEDDLGAMNSNETTEVTAAAPQKITSKEMGEFYNLYKKILNN